MMKKADKIMAGGYALNIPRLVEINVIFDVLNNPFGYISSVMGNLFQKSGTEMTKKGIVLICCVSSITEFVRLV